MKRKNNRSCLVIIILFIFISMCFATVLSALLFFYLPARAQSIFGPPSNALNFYNRIIISAQVVLNSEELISPMANEGNPRNFSVETGEGVESILYRLETDMFIRDGQILRLYLVYSGLDTGIQAGDFELSPAQSPVEIAIELQDATPEDVEFIILPGWRLEEIAGAIPSSGLQFLPQDFLSLVYQTNLSYIVLAESDIFSMEGLILAGSYNVPRVSTAEEFTEILLNSSENAVSSEILESLSQRGLSVYQGFIMASMIERESIDSGEMALISSVFHNRFALGMRFESDPTVQYALGYNESQQTWWTNPLSWSDLEIDSLFNTYINAGFPPGPICAPSMEALIAAAFPAESRYLYFRARCDNSGLHNFAETYEEHLNNACP